jgi:hypothetical protein
MAGRHRKAAWNPALHPRTASGRFDFVVGAAARGSQRQVLGRHAAPSDDRVGRDPAAADFGGSVSSFRPQTPAVLFPSEQDEARYLSTADPFPHQEFPRDESWRSGYAVGSPVARRVTEENLVALSFHDTGVEMVQEGRRDLGEGGAVNLSVTRGRLHDNLTGRDLPGEVVTKEVKRAEEVQSEILGTEVGHAIGASAPIVVADQLNGNMVHMEAIDGHSPFRFGGSTEDVRNLMTDEQWTNYQRSAGLMYYQDVITGNRDRHDGNWFITENGHAAGIDTGLSFGVGWPTMHDKSGIDKRYEGWSKLGQKSGDFPRFARQIPLAEVEMWGDDLRSMRPEFEARGRGAWHDGMMRNYEQVLEWRRSFE